MKKIFYTAGFLYLVLYGISCIDVNDPRDSGQKPVIDRLSANPASVKIGDTSTVTVEARDLEGETLSYLWSVVTTDGGYFIGDVTGPQVRWIAPTTAKTCSIKVEVRNESNKSAYRILTISVTQTPEPLITFIYPTTYIYIPSSTVSVNCNAKLTDNDMTADTIKCLINDKIVLTVTKTNNIIYNWNILQENGEKTITIIARRLYSGTLYTATSSVTVSIEGTIGKRK